MDGVLTFFEQMAMRVAPHRNILRVVGLVSLGGLIEALWLRAGLHQLFYFVLIAWTLGLTLLIPIYMPEHGRQSWARRASEIISNTMAFFTALWYVILIILTIAIVIKLAFG